MPMINKSVQNVLFSMTILIILYGAHKALFTVQEGKKRRRRNKSKNRKNSKKRNKRNKRNNVDDGNTFTGKLCNVEDFVEMCKSGDGIVVGKNSKDLLKEMGYFNKFQTGTGTGMTSFPMDTFDLNVCSHADTGEPVTHNDQVVSNIFSTARNTFSDEENQNKFIDALYKDIGCCPHPKHVCGKHGFTNP